MPSRLKIAFEQTGLPRSQQRMLVVQLLAEATDHPTIKQLHALARRTDPSISRASVFRALSALVKAGLATVLETRRGMFRYEDATLGAHDHLVDRETGELVNITSSELDEAVEQAASSLGYRVTGRRLMIWAQRIATHESAG